MLWLAQGFSRTDKALLRAGKLFHKELFQQADRGEGGTVCFQDEVMTTHPYFKDEISGLCQHSNTVEPATYAKLNCDLTASPSQPTDTLAAHIIPLGQGVCALILRFFLETFVCQCYIYCNIGFQVMNICISVVTPLQGESYPG